MRVLLTGAFGNVGLSTLDELIKRGYKVRTFDIDNKRNRRIAKKYKSIEAVWGDLRNKEDVKKAVSGQDVVIHLGAIIPPLADQKPKLAEAVNVGGTNNIIQAIKEQSPRPRLIYTSSIAIYGDRRKKPLIKTNDRLKPNPGDQYAKQKVRCEGIIRKSRLKWVIFRLTYIVSTDKLKLDPLLFHMPLDTYIEICHTKDAGLALANAVECKKIWGETMHISGGEKCRTIFGEYINRMFEILGLGRDFLPPEAFSRGGFHCGFMNTDISQKYLNYQRYNLGDYFDEVRKQIGIKRYFMMILRPIMRYYLLNKSPYYKSNIA